MKKNIEKLVFVSYLDRSGSTFFISRIGALNHAFAFPECEWIIDNILVKDYRNIITLKKELLNAINNDEKLKNWKFTANEINEIFKKSKTQGEVFLEILNTYKNKYDTNAFIGVFKRQDILSFKEKIMKRLNNNINLYWFSIIRNPIDVYLSMKNTLNPYTNEPFEVNVFKFIKRWNSSIFLINKKSKEIFVYKIFVSKYEEDLKHISKVLNIDYSFMPEKIKKFYNRLSEKDKILHVKILKDSKFIEKNTQQKLSVLERLLIKLFLCRKKKYIYINSLANFIYFCVARFCKLKK